MLIFSFGVGILHLFAGLAISFYTKWKLKQRLDAVFDVGSWYLLLLGAVILIAGPMLGFADSIANMLSQIGKYMAIAGAVMVVLFTSRDSKNIFARFGAGLYNLYGISGYLSDILSYSRLLALSLATGVIAQVVNTMGSMGGDSIAGAIILTVVFLLGHTLNIAINLLGSFVHTNRLQYVEFFAKFYEGSGRLFSPLRTHTRYIKLKEDQMHG